MRAPLDTLFDLSLSLSLSLARTQLARDVDRDVLAALLARR